MKVLIAADKFKNSLSSFEVCEAVALGFKNASSEFNTIQLPLSDGGDGLVDIISYYTNSEKIGYTVFDPLFRPIKANLLLSLDKRTAFIEMAQASGLNLLKPEEYNCNLTSTFGTGQLIKEALHSGAEKIILGIGGSATNDCGIGMAAALGYRFLDKEDLEVRPIGANLINIKTIDSSKKLDLDAISIQVACDVSNHLAGENGATKVYAPQKGATPEMVEQLETGMLHFAEIVKRDLGTDILTIKGGGAAGGMGAGCSAFLNANLVSGIDLVFKYSKIEEYIKEVDLVITGEGRIDLQTLNGKLIDGISRLCLRYNKPLIALCGTLDLNDDEIKELNLTAAFSIINKPMPIEEAFAKAVALLTATATQIAGIYKTK